MQWPPVVNAIAISILAISFLLLLSVLASKVSHRIGIPALLFFLILGMVFSHQSFETIRLFERPAIAQYLGVIALSLILFSGGLDTQSKDIKPVVRAGISLSTIGVLGTAVLIGLFAMYFFEFTFYQGMLLGAIVSSTDGAAVFSVLRTKNVGLKGRCIPLLELESGSNDPMAVFLALGIMELIKNPDTHISGIAWSFLAQMSIGAIFGYGFGLLLWRLVNKLKLEDEGLYPVLTLSGVLLTYSVTACLGGSGFLAVYLAGLVLGNRPLLYKKSLLRFHSGIAWLMQISMFLTLGLLVVPYELVRVSTKGAFFAAFLMLVARPIAVFASLSFSRLNWREKSMIAWVGLRGAAPIILATFPLVDGLPLSRTIFNLVFFIVLASVLFQGTSIARFAKLLNLDTVSASKRPSALEFVFSGESSTDLHEFLVPKGSPISGKTLGEMGLPRDALIAMINRSNRFVVPRGTTQVQDEDILQILASDKDLDAIGNIISPRPPRTLKA